jgi:hypothetical protein
VVPVRDASARLRRCVRHEARAAVARCGVCGGAFCRECAVTHDGRVYCAPCLQRVAQQPTMPTPPRRGWSLLVHAFSTFVALLIVWAVFVAFGAVLVRIPVEVHDGTIWREKAPGLHVEEP